MITAILAFKILFGNITLLKDKLNKWFQSEKVSEIHNLAYEVLIKSLDYSDLDLSLRSKFRTIFSVNRSQLLEGFREVTKASNSFAEIFTLEFEAKLAKQLELLITAGNYDLNISQCNFYIQKITEGFCKLASDERSEKQGIQILIEKADLLSNEVAQLAKDLAIIKSSISTSIKFDEQFLKSEKRKTVLEIVKKRSRNAIKFLRTFEYQAGIDLLQELITELNEYDVDANELFASIYTNIAIGYLNLNQQGKYNENILKSIEFGTPTSSAILNAYWVYSAIGNIEKANAMFQELQASHPMSEEFLSARLDKIEEFDTDAEALISDSKRLFRESPEINYRIAQIYLKNNMLDDYSNHMDKAVQLHPDSLLRIGTQHATQLQFKICDVIRIGVPVEINEEEKKRLIKSMKLYLEIWAVVKNSSASKTFTPHLINLSNVYYSLHQKEESFKYLQIAHDLNSSDLTYSRLMLWQFREGNYHKAKLAGKKISNILELEMNDALIVYIQILINGTNNDKEEALETIEKAVKLRPTDDNLLYIKGITLLSNSNYDKALSLTLAEQKKQPSNARYYILASRIYYSSDRFDNAITSIKLAIERISSAESIVKSDLLSQLWKMKEYQLIVKESEKIGEANLCLLELRNYEFSLIQVKNDKKRLQFYSRMIDRFGINKFFSINYWILLDKYRDYKTAIQICRKYLLHNPLFAEAKIDLCELLMKEGASDEAAKIDLDVDARKLDYRYLMKLLTQLLFLNRNDKVIDVLYSRYRYKFDAECTDVIMQTFIVCNFREEDIQLKVVTDKTAIKILNTFSNKTREFVLIDKDNLELEDSDEIGPGNIFYDICKGQSLEYKFVIPTNNAVIKKEEYKIVAIYSLGKYLFDKALIATEGVYKEKSNFFALKGQSEEHLNTMLDSILKLDDNPEISADRSKTYNAYLNMEFPSGLVCHHYQLHSFVFHYTVLEKLGMFPDRPYVFESEILHFLRGQKEIQFCIDLTGVLSLYKMKISIKKYKVHVAQSTVDLIRLMIYTKDTFQSNSWSFNIQNGEEVLLEASTELLIPMIDDLPGILSWIEKNLQPPSSSIARLDYSKEYVDNMDSVVDPSIVDTLLTSRKYGYCPIVDDFSSRNIELLETRSLIISSKMFQSLIN